MALQHRKGNARKLDIFAVWALPRSLATTKGISVDFYYAGYLDVSVPPLFPLRTMYSSKR